MSQVRTGAEAKSWQQFEVEPGSDRSRRQKSAAIRSRTRFEQDRKKKAAKSQKVNQVLTKAE
ncbi:hypothetical protein ACFYKX_21105 [Cytobacillus sp. FJAT-54145]|uniref:Uncharacterized protein n=1 Tax=Cytobacillus spartinae TaxID=3299023 RepID=A0ABW6KK37_9BACI